MNIVRARLHGNKISPILKHLGVFLLMIYLYVLILGYIGGIDSVFFYRQWVELLLLSYFYIYSYTILKESSWRWLIAIIPVLASYLVQDVFYLFYGKVFRLIEILELPELVQVITLGYWFIIIVILILPLLLFVVSVNYRRWQAIVLGLLPLGFVIGMIVMSPTSYTSFLEKYAGGIVKYSDTKSAERNGRFAMLFYKEAERLNALQLTDAYRDRASYEDKISEKLGMLKQVSNQKNVHLIVLESFLDPRLFKRMRFSQSPVHPEFKRLFNKKLGLSISSVFGGSTAQAEFEVLCGVPALEKLSSVEFNVFTGSAVYCMPGIMSRMGYQTIATNAYKPNFFNALPAYKGLGFNEIYFPQEFTSTGSSYLSVGGVGDEDYLFDGKLFDQNLEFIANKLKDNNGAPIFNYMMTIYGHTPHILDKKLRPEIIKVQSDYADDHLQRSTNQFYYRTQAIAKYVKELIKLDKNSLIILVSDHVPPLRNGPNTYRKLDYMGNIENYYYYNRLMIIDNGKPVVYRDIRHFDMPDIVYNYLSDGGYCESQPCTHLGKQPMLSRESFIDQYYSIMAHASE